VRRHSKIPVICFAIDRPSSLNFITAVGLHTAVCGPLRLPVLTRTGPGNTRPGCALFHMLTGVVDLEYRIVREMGPGLPRRPLKMVKPCKPSIPNWNIFILRRQKTSLRANWRTNTIMTLDRIGARTPRCLSNIAHSETGVGDAGKPSAGGEIMIEVQWEACSSNASPI
jgi:hypothetical protein